MAADNKFNDALDKTARYSTEQFDKNILFIASGSLGISFAFIKDIVPDFSQATHKGTLIASWYIFAIVIFISLATHFISMQASTWAFKNEKLDDNLFNAKLRCWNIPIRILNISMIMGIFIGALFLIYFIHQNL
ncbi:MAG: hypothetical protein GQ574_25630 [Crocinitomix sp.]|nr:hypothetical protein [Crocinitomix sp.]